MFYLLILFHFVILPALPHPLHYFPPPFRSRYDPLPPPTNKYRRDKHTGISVQIGIPVGQLDVFPGHDNDLRGPLLYLTLEATPLAD